MRGKMPGACGGSENLSFYQPTDALRPTAIFVIACLVSVEWVLYGAHLQRLATRIAAMPAWRLPGS